MGAVILSNMNYSRLSKSTSDSSSNFTSTANLSQFSTQSNREAFQTLKVRSQLVHLTSTEINIILENFRKEMFLRYLILATCPLATYDTMATRQTELQNTLKEMIVAWQLKLKETSSRMNEIKDICDNIATRRDEFLTKFRVKKTSVAELNRVEEYHRIFKAIQLVSKKNYDEVTSEYLILRHNGKLAQEVINEQREEALHRRHETCVRLEQAHNDNIQKVT